jgi:hypothetical protein
MSEFHILRARHNLTLVRIFQHSWLSCFLLVPIIIPCGKILAISAVYGKLISVVLVYLFANSFVEHLDFWHSVPKSKYGISVFYPEEYIFLCKISDRNYSYSRNRFSLSKYNIHIIWLNPTYLRFTISFQNVLSFLKFLIVSTVVLDWTDRSVVFFFIIIV